MTTIDPVLAGATPQATPAKAKDDLGKDAFLKLLVAQLKYQDPLNPTEGAEFMAQTAQFNMVEKLQELSEQNAALLSSQQAVAGSSLIGRTITHPGAAGLDVTGVVTGVRLGADGLVLKVGDQDVPLASVTEVRATVPPAG